MANKFLVLIFLDLTQVITPTSWKRFLPLAPGTAQYLQSPPYCFLISLLYWFLLFFPTSVRGLHPRISSLLMLSAWVTSCILIALNTIDMLKTLSFTSLAQDPSTELWTHISNCLLGISHCIFFHLSHQHAIWVNDDSSSRCSWQTLKSHLWLFSLPLTSHLSHQQILLPLDLNGIFSGLSSSPAIPLVHTTILACYLIFLPWVFPPLSLSQLGTA